MQHGAPHGAYPGTGNECRRACRAQPHQGDQPMGSLLHRQSKLPAGTRHAGAGQCGALSRQRSLTALCLICSVPASAAGETGFGLELGAESFGIQLKSPAAPKLIDSSLPAGRLAIVIQGEHLDFKQTLIYGSGKSIEGRAWHTDTRLGYRSELGLGFAIEPLISVGAISVTPDYGTKEQSNVKTKYAMAGGKLQYAGDVVSLGVEAQIGRNLSPTITNVVCTPGLSGSLGVEGAAKYFGGWLVVGGERKNMPMGNGYQFEVSHVYADYRFLF